MHSIQILAYYAKGISMITEIYDAFSEPIRLPPKKENAPRLDVCIVTFSYVIEEAVKNAYHLS